ncbi:NADPH-dependent F420 reductase [Microbacterium oxydans]|uniref:NADP oxidoreductase coenzyme F420-dependent n=1 Tax=Microbacterium oxydans TaxID=82380 RepID=A0A0F0L595_9MICO|nr:NAD(P)-binding domain-containing protein [Microbacterium oxydans]KJL27505.1 NADP oxidoreductase coenzyme F420-dependent [Microbacterium oxydans]
MKIAIIGTGMVGRGLAARLAGLGHDVVIGTRDVDVTLARTTPDGMGTPPYVQWQQENSNVRLVTLPEAGAHGEVVINAANGQNALAALEGVGAEPLAGKVLLDLALPLDLSKGLPPTLTISNTDSLGEQIQRAFPDARVVKSLNSVYYQVMIDPTRVPGPHSIFVAGDDSDAKSIVEGLLGEFGWPTESIIDLGDITGARGVEMYARLFFTLYNAFGTFDFNINVTRAN